jgi:AcrR family transcriptional regulator
MAEREKARIPKQQRSRQTRSLIMGAGMKLFCEKGFHATNSNEIAAEAGIPVGSFYAYFDDKKHLFLEVLTGYLDQLKSAAERASDMAYRSGEEFLHALIKAMLESHRISPKFHRETTIMRLSDPDIGEVMAGYQKVVLQVIAGSLANGSGIKVEDPEAAAFLILGALERTVHGIVFSETDIPENRLVRETTAMVLKYLS